MNTTLLIMAAGIGSRFGTGIKQLEPVDDANHDEEAYERAKDIRVMSRARPTDKQRLVAMLQKRQIPQSDLQMQCHSFLVTR